jgi:hypothetical protein
MIGDFKRNGARASARFSVCGNKTLKMSGRLAVSHIEAA